MRELLQRKYTAAVVAMALTLALLVTVFAPLGAMERTAPQNPFRDGQALPIDSVDLGVVADGSLGEAIQSAGTGQQGGEASTESAADGQQEQMQEQGQQQAQPDAQDQSQSPSEKPEPTPNEPQDPQENGDGEQQDANEGEEGGEEQELDLGLVLTWYKYGTEANTVVCGPNSAVGRTIKDTQLKENRLRYHLEFTGDDGGDCTVQQVRFGRRYTSGTQVETSGTVELTLPQGESQVVYCFTVTALWEGRDADGQAAEQELEFEIAIYYESGLDLDMNLNWTDKDGKTGTIRCAADKTASVTVKRSHLENDSLPYTLEMTGESARDAEFVSAAWSSDTGDRGELSQSGRWTLQKPEGDRIQYTLRVEVRVDERPVTFVYTLNYESSLDLNLEFTWYEGGLTAQTLRCEANESTSLSIKRSQLSGDQLQYAMALSGESAADASILSARLSPGDSLKTPSGSTFLSLPEDGGKAKYTLTVTARTGGSSGETVNFTIPITYTGDVSLRMQYEAMVDGRSETFTVSCENGRTKQADALSDDQLTGDLLAYTLELTGDDAAGLTITEVSCYQSGSGKSISLTHPSGTVKLLLDGKKTGENTITVKASDANSTVYQFKINIPYQHKGENTVKIQTNFVEGQVVANESEVTLMVEAWSENDDGTVKEHILATGVGTELTVQLDGKTYTYTSTTGNKQQYTLIPENPVEGDTNEHVLTIRAVDSEGNWGEYSLTFTGERSMKGQVIGTATITVDLGVLGLGIYGPVSYEVLKDEPVSYVVAKALFGEDCGDFGTAKETFGFTGGYGGSLDSGFYLQRLGTGSDMSGAQAILSSGWSSLGSTEEEILAAIDAQFGQGSSFASLWRCIYRNGLLLGGMSSSTAVGEHDFTSGSGWLYAVNGTYPGSGMSEYYLQDGDRLTLRYTLAYGWDVGSGTAGYGGTVGYCVSWNGSSFTLNHQWQEQEDGTKMCSCCGLRTECEHLHTQWQDQEDGTCGLFCEDCQKLTQPAQAHEYETQFREENLENHVRVCKNCQHEEEDPHRWKQSESTVTCTEAGTITYTCELCNGTKEEQAEATGHQPEDWECDKQTHYQVCAACGDKIEGTEGAHTYEAEGQYWCCKVCGTYHDFTCGSDRTLELMTDQSTCQKSVYRCSSCGLSFEREENSDRHQYGADGFCIYGCGAQDPNYSAGSGGEGDGHDGDGGDSGDLDPTLPEEPDAYRLMAAQATTETIIAEHGREKNRRNHHAGT